MELVGNGKGFGSEDVGDEDGGRRGEGGDSGAESRDMAAHGGGEAANDRGVSDVRHVDQREFDDGEETDGFGSSDDFVFSGGGVGGGKENGDGEVVARGEARGKLE